LRLIDYGLFAEETFAKK